MARLGSVPDRPLELVVDVYEAVVHLGILCARMVHLLGLDGAIGDLGLRGGLRRLLAHGNCFRWVFLLGLGGDGLVVRKHLELVLLLLKVRERGSNGHDSPLVLLRNRLAALLE